MSDQHKYKKGDKVFFNGDFEGFIWEVCTGTLEGMVIVAVEGRPFSQTCISLKWVRPRG